jgi:hypothetical protein
LKEKVAQGSLVMSFTIFISHKHRDYDLAREIRLLLQRLAETEAANQAVQPRVNIFLSEDLSIGPEWRKDVGSMLQVTNWFILIYTGVADEEWAWPSYELGMFHGIHEEYLRARMMAPNSLETIVDTTDPEIQERRVICIYHELSSPPIIAAAGEALKANDSSIRKLLERFSDLIGYYKNEKVADIDGAARNIYNLFKNNVRRYDFLDSMTARIQLSLRRGPSFGPT